MSVIVKKIVNVRVDIGNVTPTTNPPISSMKKLYYIPAVIFGLHCILSFVMAGYFLFTHQAGEASLAIIFTFTGMIATTWMVALANN